MPISKKIMIISGTCLLIVVSIVIYFMLKAPPAPPACPAGKISACDGTACSPSTCPPGQTFSCLSKSCSCPLQQSLCGGVCCPTDSCKNNKCCTNPCAGAPDGCCPSGTSCSSDGKSCLVLCGPPDSTGKTTNSCSAGQSCVIVKNIPKDKIAALESQYKGQGAVFDEPNGTMYMCKSPSAGCAWTGFDSAAPAIQNNYYPCFNYQSSGQAGSGFCTSSALSPSLKQNCYSHPDPTSCSADTTNSCTWWNALAAPVSSTNAEVSTITGGSFGDYCDPKNGEAFSRIVQVQGNNQCTWQDCFSNLSQPGVVDIEFTDATGTGPSTCSVLQSCGSGGIGYSNCVIDPATGACNPNPSIVPPIQPSSNTSFPTCSSSPPCPVKGVLSCFPDTGIIGGNTSQMCAAAYPNCTKCSTDSNNNIDGCVQCSDGFDPTGTGKSTCQITTDPYWWTNQIGSACNCNQGYGGATCSQGGGYDCRNGSVPYCVDTQSSDYGQTDKALGCFIADAKTHPVYAGKDLSYISGVQPRSGAPFYSEQGKSNSWMATPLNPDPTQAVYWNKRGGRTQIGKPELDNVNSICVGSVDLTNITYATSDYTKQTSVGVPSGHNPFC